MNPSMPKNLTFVQEVEAIMSAYTKLYGIGQSGDQPLAVLIAPPR